MSLSDLLEKLTPGGLSHDDTNREYLTRLLEDLDAMLATEADIFEGPAEGRRTDGNDLTADVEERKAQRLRSLLRVNSDILETLTQLEKVHWDPTQHDTLLRERSPGTRKLVSKLADSIKKRRAEERQIRAAAALAVRRARSRRPRAGRHSPNGSGGVHFEPDAQPVLVHPEGDTAAAPTLIDHHDMLIVAPKGVHSSQQFFRFPVCKREDAGHQVGKYHDKPELMDEHDYGQRKVLAVSRPQDWASAHSRALDRGPAFVTLPVKPEPGATSCAVCYLVNTQNLNFRNAWTAEEWNDIPGGPDLPPAPGASKPGMEALVAGPQGKVFRLALPNVAQLPAGMHARIVVEARAGEPPGPGEVGTLESVELRPHMEVWHQLRNGAVIGRVLFEDASGPRVVPLVNITSLTRD
jgi:hypothetical protein